MWPNDILDIIDLFFIKEYIISFNDFYINLYENYSISKNINMYLKSRYLKILCFKI